VLRKVAPSRQHGSMSRLLLVVWLAVLVMAGLVAVVVWRQFGWDRAGIAVVAALFVFVVGAPGALNSLRQLGEKSQRRSKGNEGRMKVNVADSGSRRFSWSSPESRALLRALSSELPSHDDIITCARASGTTLSRARLSGTPDNAWQSLVEIAHESQVPGQLSLLLDAAAERSSIVKNAVDAYRVSEQS
jgi:hypothetical protein